MAAPIIEVQNVGKRYRLGVARHDMLRDRIVHALRAPLRMLQKKNGRPDDFWALRDVSFEVQPGEVIGIVGRNGAGKSTLLKVLSRITEPTTGRVVIRGRVASLLEVGTGFHPELSGRENIFLNGAILGMSRAEIRRKFDEIVAFAEVERFLDTPVKHYSSGMYVRLAFAVAAHLEPEILIIDEVLAVGDAQFQKKCLGKMQQVAASEGRTVLFVSHNLNAIKQLCSNAILMSSGRIACSGRTAQVLNQYFQSAASEPSVDLRAHPNRGRSVSPRFVSLEMTDAHNQLCCRFSPGDTVRLSFRIRTESRITEPRVGIGFTTSAGERIFAIATFLGPKRLSPVIGEARFDVEFEMPPVMPASYELDISLSDGSSRQCDEIYNAATIDVIESNYLDTTHPYFREMGYLMVRSRWTQS